MREKVFMGLFDWIKKKNKDHTHIVYADKKWNYCPICGKEIQKEWKVCPFCGNTLGFVENSKSELKGELTTRKTDGLEIVDGVLIKYTGTDQDVYVPVGVKEIARAVFENSDIRSISLPEGLEKIGSSCFTRCSSLTHINIPRSLKSVGGRIFFQCSKLQTLGVGSQFNISVSVDMECIPDELFSSCIGLKSVELPSGITKIGEKAFAYCESIQQFTIPRNCTKVGDNAFMYCESLSKVKFDSKRVSFEGNVFEKCEKLIDKKGFSIVSDTLYGYYGKESSISIPDGVKEIANSAFRCGAFGIDSEQILEMIIPDSVERIGSNAFQGCCKLSKVKMSNNIRWVGDGIFDKCENLDEIIVGTNIPKELKDIIIQVEEKARIRRKSQEERQRIQNAKRKISNVLELQKEIEVFVKAYSGSEDSVKMLVSYIITKLPDSIFREGDWYFYDDAIVYRYELCAHSFFDDGGGEEYKTFWKFSYTDSMAADGSNKKLDNSKLTDIQEYPIFEGSRDNFICKNPFGLFGEFEVQFYSYYARD